MIVLDASAAVNIAQGTEEGKAFEGLLFSGEKIISCDLMRVEVASALWKYVRAGLNTSEEARAKMNAILSLVDEFVPVEELGVEVLSESIRLDHSPYDIYYLVTARRTGATLMSTDKRLNALCDECGVGRVHEVELS